MPQSPSHASILQRIRELLLQFEIRPTEIEHAATTTSEDSARARGEPLHVGAKALLLKVDEAFRLFVLPADRKLDSAAIKKYFGAKKIRFATADELLQFTGLVPGSVPPFGEPILPFALFADTAIGSIEDKVAFNAGSLTHSMILPATLWRQASKPVQFSFSSEA